MTLRFLTTMYRYKKFDYTFFGGVSCNLDIIEAVSIHFVLHFFVNYVENYVEKNNLKFAQSDILGTIYKHFLSKFH